MKNFYHAFVLVIIASCGCSADVSNTSMSEKQKTLSKLQIEAIAIGSSRTAVHAAVGKPDMSQTTEGSELRDIYYVSAPVQGKQMMSVRYNKRNGEQIVAAIEGPHTPD